MFINRTRPNSHSLNLRLSVILIVVFGVAGGNAFAQPRSFAEIAKKVGPAVVNIDTKSKVSQPVAKSTATPGKDRKSVV